MKKEVRKRYWAFIAYPDSVPQNWLELLQGTGLMMAISPLHDSDMNADETQKKPHWHVLLAYKGPTSYKPVLRVAELINATAPQPLESIKGYYRYLTHADNPEKAQYSTKDIKHLNGFSVRDFLEMTKGEALEAKKQILQIIKEKNLTEYCDLIELLQDNDDLLDFASNHTLFFDAFLRSRRWKISHPETGNFLDEKE
ncbi:replication protein [Helicobacter baculiformis]|uniref:replication protein n=1 Tax=Helicobacter baculiformis TaxID=427351 RepID=UPI00131507E7|nr:replication protein [Helicobacter baculiformis]